LGPPQVYTARIPVRLKSEEQQLTGQFLDADAQLKQLFKLICDVEEMARYTSASVVESKQWSCIVSMAEENRQNFYKVLTGRTLFSALLLRFNTCFKGLV
jgi:hypothetical protein